VASPEYNQCRRPRQRRFAERLAERRGFSMEAGELILQGLPEQKPKPKGRKP
jgi:hypothetical protein